METVAGWAKLLGISRYKCRRILEAAGVLADMAYVVGQRSSKPPKRVRLLLSAPSSNLTLYTRSMRVISASSTETGNTAKRLAEPTLVVRSASASRARSSRYPPHRIASPPRIA
jgi:hypothetical protein